MFCFVVSLQNFPLLLGGFTNSYDTDESVCLSHNPDPNHIAGTFLQCATNMPFGRSLYDKERLATLTLNGIPGAVSDITCASKDCCFWIICL